MRHTPMAALNNWPRKTVMRSSVMRLHPACLVHNMRRAGAACLLFAFHRPQETEEVGHVAQRHMLPALQRLRVSTYLVVRTAPGSLFAVSMQSANPLFISFTTVPFNRLVP